MKIEKIYLDMDGVIADFDKTFEDLYKMQPGKFEAEFGQTAFWEKVYETPTFFKYMLPTPRKNDIWDLCKTRCQNVIILSSPSRTNQPICMLHKRDWLDRLVGKHVPAIFEAHKHKYAGPNRLLIDDTKKKIDKWVEHGGIGHLYTDFERLSSFIKQI